MPDWFVEAFTEAGFCWGGDWQSIKDPMHFSWMGPAHTPGHSQPSLQPVLTEEDRKYRTRIDLNTAGDTSVAGVAVPVVADFDRDGAADLGRVTHGTLAGHGSLTFSQAHHGYETCLTTATVRTTFDGTARIPLTADFTGDGRPDLALVITTGDTLRVNIHRWERMDTRRRLTTAIASSGVIDVRAGDLDADGHTDLVVHRDRGNRTRIEIWAGPDFTVRTAMKRVRSTIVSPRLATGDENLDSRTDVYLLGAEGRRHIMYGPDLSDGKARLTDVTPQAGEHFYVYDYDGDGRRDLWLARGDLSARVFLGGRRTASSDLDYWFVDDTNHWWPGQGCGPVTASDDFEPVAIEGLPAGVAAAAPSGADHLVSAPNLPDRSGWSLDQAGEHTAVASSPDGALLVDVAIVDGRGRITAIAAESGRRLWVLGMPNDVTPVAAWTDGTTVTVVSRTETGGTDIQWYRDGERIGRETHAALAASFAAPHGDGAAVLGIDPEGQSVIALVVNGVLTSQATLPHEPVWLGASDGHVVAVTGLSPTRITVFEDDGAGGLSRIGRTGLGPALILAGDTTGDGSAVFGYRRPRGRTIVVSLDLATLDKQIVGRTPFDHEPVSVSASSAHATVAIQRITDGSWRLVDIDL